MAAGFLAGLATGIRLSMAMALVPLAVSALVGPTQLTRRQRGRAVAGAAAAAVVANVPVLWLLAVAPSRVLFGNLGYPALSTDHYGSLHQPGLSLLGKVGSSLSKFVTDPGNLVLLLAFAAVAVGPVWTRRRRPGPFRHEVRLAIGLVAALWVGAMGPTPMMQQYNYALVPFMLLAVLYALAAAGGDGRRWVRLVAVVSLVVGGSGLRWYWWVVRLPTPGRWEPVVQHAQGRWIRSLTGPGARVLTIESTIPLEGGLDIYPEYATGQFVLLTAGFLPAERRRAQGMVAAADLPALLDARPPDAVFARIPATADLPLVAYASQHGYRRFVSADHVNQLWLRPGLGPR